MLTNNAYIKYQQMNVETASQEKLIIMMYEGAIKFIKLAMEAIKEKKYDMVNENIKRTEDIIMELMISLNMDAGEVAKNLYNVYNYLYNRLIEANIKKDTEILEEVLKYLMDYKETWEEVFRKVKSGSKNVGKIDLGV